MTARPELSSLATSLNQLTEQLTAIADSMAGGDRDELAASLYEVERSMVAAGRRLERIVSDLR